MKNKTQKSKLSDKNTEKEIILFLIHLMINNAENEWVVDQDFNGLRIDYWIKKNFRILAIHLSAKS